jgi:hypothetical protein
LFDGPESYESFVEGFDREVLGGNTIASWLQSMILPDRET